MPYLDHAYSKKTKQKHGMVEPDFRNYINSSANSYVIRTLSNHICIPDIVKLNVNEMRRNVEKMWEVNTHLLNCHSYYLNIHLWLNCHRTKTWNDGFCLYQDEFSCIKTD